MYISIYISLYIYLYISYFVIAVITMSEQLTQPTSFEDNIK